MALEKLSAKYFASVATGIKLYIHPDEHHLFEHVYVRISMASYFNISPPPAKSPKTTWEINQVLEYWKQQPNNRELQIIDLAR